MAPRKAPSKTSSKLVGPTAVEAIVHTDKRANIPTADGRDFIEGTPAELPIPLRWARDPSLDPQLVWKGKDTGADELQTEAPPIYIQEKIDPRVLIENLRDTAKAGEPEPELTLFDSFDGLNEMELVDFYRHEANWSNRMILGDSLQVMGSLAEREGLRGKVQMIYLDPPYGIKFGSNWQMSTRKRDVKDGKMEDASFEVEQIKAFRDTWELGIHSYLSYLRDRLMVARDLLTESGSIFVQIGDENVHLVRAVMDEVLGDENFVSQITIRTTSSATSQYLPGTADHVLWYAKSHGALKYRQPYMAKGLGSGADLYSLLWLGDGAERRATSEERSNPSALPVGARLFRPDNLTSQRPPGSFPVSVNGRTYLPGKGYWKTGEEGMAKLATAGRLRPTSGDSIQYVRFLDDFPAVALGNVWTDVGTGSFTEDKVYVVQTNTKIIERCMLMCTDPGDLVLDPTCGSGTTAYVAEQWGRRWITMDTSRVALALARQRLMGAKFPYFLLADSPEGRAKEQQLTGQALPLSASAGDIRQGFVYERVQHITLKSIANNPDIHDGMSRTDIDAAIKRHADFEMLYDKPYEDNRKVRVTGPFTVESLSPHRSLAFSGAGPDPELPRTEAAAGADPTAGFEQMIIANLAKAGIQNGRRNERLTFAGIDAYPGQYIQSIGERAEDPSTTSTATATEPAGADDSEHGATGVSSPKRVGIAIGPQYGTVGPSFIKKAALEGIRAKDVDLLVVLAFAFDPDALGADVDYIGDNTSFAGVQSEKSMGRLPVLLVRMNNDLVMGDDLKKTGSGNLFTVFGEPDIDIRTEGNKVVVEVKGIDVYDPTTGEVRSQDTEHIALWLLDTNYNEESFFVRHCYFTGGNDPYARLKRALKSDIDEDAWASLYSTTSRPFEKPTTGKIAVKVINDYGDEVMQVFDA